VCTAAHSVVAKAVTGPLAPAVKLCGCLTLQLCLWCLLLVLQLARNYYGSRQQLLADAEMIVQAARSYHTIGRGRQATPGIITLAQSTLTEGGKAWDNSDDRGLAEYWEARVQVWHVTDPPG